MKEKYEIEKVRNIRLPIQKKKKIIKEEEQKQ